MHSPAAPVHYFKLNGVTGLMGSQCYLPPDTSKRAPRLEAYGSCGRTAFMPAQGPSLGSSEWPLCTRIPEDGPYISRSLVPCSQLQHGCSPANHVTTKKSQIFSKTTFLPICVGQMKEIRSVSVRWESVTCDQTEKMHFVKNL